MRKNCSSTPPAWAFPDLEYADNSATNGGGSINRVESSNRVDSNTKRGSTSPKGALSPQAANDPPVALCCLEEKVDKPLEWVVEGVIPRGELTLITGEAGVGKSAFLTGLIANVTRGMPVLEAELERLRASGVEVSMMVIDSVHGYVESPKRRSLLAAEVEKLVELARKFKVAIVLAANVSPAAMQRPNRPRGMAGIHAMALRSPPKR